MTKSEFITEEQSRTLNNLMKKKKYNEHIKLMEKINSKYHSKYGYPTITIKDECKYLKLNAINLVKEAHSVNINNNKIISDEEMKLIKEAHYFSVNWSSLCD